MPQLSRRQGQFVRRELVAISIFVLATTTGCQVVAPNGMGNANNTGVSASMSNNDIWNAITANSSVGAFTYSPTLTPSAVAQTANPTPASVPAVGSRSSAPYFAQRPTAPAVERPSKSSVASSGRVVAARPSSTSAAKARSPLAQRTQASPQVTQERSSAMEQQLSAARQRSNPKAMAAPTAANRRSFARSTTRPKFGGHFTPSQIVAAKELDARRVRPQTAAREIAAHAAQRSTVKPKSLDAVRRLPTANAVATRASSLRPDAATTSTAAVASLQERSGPVMHKSTEQGSDALVSVRRLPAPNAEAAAVAVTPAAVQDRPSHEGLAKSGLAKPGVASSPMQRIPRATTDVVESTSVPYPATQFANIADLTLRHKADVSQPGGIALSEMPAPPPLEEFAKQKQLADPTATAQTVPQGALLRLPVEGKLDASALAGRQNKSRTPIVSRIPFLAKDTPHTESPPIKIEIDEAPTVEGSITKAPSQLAQNSTRDSVRSRSKQTVTSRSNTSRGNELANRDSKVRKPNPIRPRTTKPAPAETSVAKKRRSTPTSVLRLPASDVPKVEDNKPPMAVASTVSPQASPKREAPKLAKNIVDRPAKTSNSKAAERFPMRGAFMASSKIADKRNRRNASPLLRKQLGSTSPGRRLATQRRSREDEIASSDASLLRLPQDPKSAIVSASSVRRMPATDSSPGPKKFGLQQPVSEWGLPEPTVKVAPEQVEQIARLPSVLQSSDPNEDKPESKPAAKPEVEAKVTTVGNPEADMLANFLQASTRGKVLTPMAKFSRIQPNVVASQPAVATTADASTPMQKVASSATDMKSSYGLGDPNQNQPLASIEPPAANTESPMAHPTLRTAAVVKLAPAPVKHRLDFDRSAMPTILERGGAIRIGRLPTEINMAR